MVLPSDSTPQEFGAEEMESARVAASSGTLTINLDAITDNYRLIQSETKAEVSACVKADGYGLGLVPVARTLAHAGCSTFFVATALEGSELRSVLPKAKIYVLNGLYEGTEQLFDAEDLRPCLSSLEEVRDWAAYCGQKGPLPAALHGDTGIHRLGIQAHDLAAVADLAPSFETDLVMSHLACADNADHPLNDEQQKSFDSLRTQLPDAPSSLANTAGILLGPRFHYDLVRPGIGLYGTNPFPNPGHPFHPVVTLTSRIMQVKSIETGAQVGYGATFTAQRPTRIATIASGYADGYFRALGSPDGSGASVTIDGHPAPVIGRVSMDMITVDVTDLPPDVPKRGCFAELIGKSVTVGDLARAAGTVGYEVLTRLGYRYHRTYTSSVGISAD
ncbi:MAG TPA: alanine racemase [Rhodobiaceae bacterium]|nr:alanine racemase [Rhodobiaceae bacterium]|tara:strand:- start:2457 stop:3626 length:1170 start_codon:yes stop_codon:yes gene_type:complete